MAEKTDPAPGRRQVLQVLAGSVGAGLAAPSLASAESGHAHAPQAAAPAAAQAAAALPGFLDAKQLETLASIAEEVVPGSTEAGVAAFVDRLLAVEARDRQREFLSALGALQAESLTRFGKTWLSLDAQQKVVLLTAISTGPSARTPRYWKAGEPVLIPVTPDRRPPTLRDRFEQLKDRIAQAYYSSEKGMKELGWTGNMVHGGYPGCTHDGGHRTT